MPQQHSPRVSVVMAVCNGGRYLDEATRSILAQTFTDFEFITIDDGSSDGSAAILQDWARSDTRVRVISGPNQGLTASLNQALAAARGEFIARMDGDDISLPQRLALQVAFLEEHRACVAAGCQAMYVDPEGLPISPAHVPCAHAEIDARLLAGQGGQIIHPAAMIRREALGQIGGYRPQYRTSQDMDLFLRLAEIGELANLPEVLLHYRLHTASVGMARRDEQDQARRQIVADARQRRGLPPAQLPDNSAWTTMTPADERRRWVVLANRAGNYATARKYAWSWVASAPFSPTAWRQWAKSWLGRRPAPATIRKMP